MTGASERSKAQPTARTGPEWVTFGVAAVILLLVVGALVGLAFRSTDPAAPTAKQPGQVREVDGRYFVPVEIVNTGDEAAAEVQVSAELVVDGVTTTGDQVIDFLGGGEVQSLTFAFADDPGAGELTVSVTGFANP